MPAPLARDAALAADARSGLTHGDAAHRRDAAVRILEQLPQADPLAQADYLLLTGGSARIPDDLLGPAWERLAAEWPGAEPYLLRVLAEPEGSAPTRLAGAVLAAGSVSWRESDLTGVVGWIGGLLDDPDQTSVARRSLERLTLRDFRNGAEFHAWWDTDGARSRSQKEWWREAALRHRDETVQLWRRRVRSGKADDLLPALASSLLEVRRLGLDGLKTFVLDPAKTEETDRARAALRDALAQETQPELRARLIELVPRFFTASAAAGILDAALDASAPGERVAAARAMQTLPDPALAAPVVAARLAAVYAVPGVRTLAGPPEFRLALVGATEALERRFADSAAAAGGGNNGTGNGAGNGVDSTQGTPDGSDERGAAAEAFRLRAADLLAKALEREDELQVRRRLYEAAARVGGAESAPLLFGYARDAARGASDRAGALVALSRVADQLSDSSELLDLLHELIGHPSPEMRYQVLLSLRPLGAPASAPYLGGRLSLESDPGLKQELLRVLGDLKDGAGLEPLLSVPPPAADQAQTRSLYLAALHSQVGADPVRLDAALLALEEQADPGMAAWSLAFAVVDGFPRENLSETAALHLEGQTARTLANWLLEEGGAYENGRRARALDAVSRLGDMATRQTDRVEWPLLQAKLLERLGDRPADSFAAWKAVFERTAAVEGRAPHWQAALAGAAAALAADLPAEGLALLQAAGAPPEGRAQEVATLNESLRTRQAELGGDAATGDGEVEEKATEAPADADADSGLPEGDGGNEAEAQTTSGSESKSESKTGGDGSAADGPAQSEIGRS
ncbi:MAG TPA: HEAT repeat domain-containing protein [Planctomycetota bacterium]